jgi:hypothetical protein
MTHSQPDKKCLDMRGALQTGQCGTDGSQARYGFAAIARAFVVTRNKDVWAEDSPP